jgi:hypothetical protein
MAGDREPLERLRHVVTPIGSPTVSARRSWLGYRRGSRSRCPRGRPADAEAALGRGSVPARRAALDAKPGSDAPIQATLEGVRRPQAHM